MSETKIAEQKQDIEELKTLISQATRTNVKQFLNTQLTKLEADLDRLVKAAAAVAAQASTTTTTTSTTTTTGYTKQIDTFGWDQSEKFVKIYITSLKDIDKVKQDDVTCNFNDRSFDLLIKTLNNVNYQLSIKNLLNSIDAKESSVKVKSDMITVLLRKKSSQNWSCLTEKEQQLKDNKPKPKLDETADPQESLMTLMKQMYEDGDDEMKRTISKAFTESREKQMRGEV